MNHSKEWDAEAYQRVSNPQYTWGLNVLNRVALVGNERVVDAGCGSGRLTAVLAERLPNGSVVAVDQSENMLAEARARLARFGNRVSFVRADLISFIANPEVDLVFSTATFHWILNHDSLFRCVRGSIRPGGRLVAQCGGAGNLGGLYALADRVGGLPSFAPYLADFKAPVFFADIAGTRERLAAAGFAHVDCWIEAAPTSFPDDDAYRVFVRTVVLRNHLAQLPESLYEPFLDRVVATAAEATPRLTLDYVRLNVLAR